MKKKIYGDQTSVSTLAAKWKTMSTQEKQEYDVDAAETRSPEKEKRKLNGYNMFIREYFADNKSADKDSGELMKEAGAHWKTLSDEQKAAYKPE